MTNKTENQGGINELSDLERITTFGNGDELIGSGILSSVISPNTPNLRRQYFEFLSNVESLARDFDSHLNKLRNEANLPAYVEYRQRRKEASDFLTEKQDKVRGAIRLVGNLRELDRVYRKEAQPSEELKKQYAKTGLTLDNSAADSRISQQGMLFFNKEDYFNRSEYGDYGNAINPYLFLKDIFMGYDSNTHYIAQVLNDLSPKFNDKNIHMSRFNMQVAETKEGVKYVRTVYTEEESERIKRLAEQESNYYHVESWCVVDQTKLVFQLLPNEFSQRADSMVDTYDSLEKNYSALYGANKALEPKRE